MTRADRLADKTLKGRSGERLGRWAEAWCRLALRLKGYQVLASRCRTPAGEIDIVALRGDLLAIVEVKARATEMAGHLAVTQAQWRRLERAAGLFVAARPRLARHAVRFDLMIVQPRRWPRHLPDAWRIQP
ncbi:MAG: YraN family protein [Azospirillaceae bacterium]|nr:YraN family protein [Azospirillaceae bacterium]